VEETDHRHCWLLRLGRKRPYARCPAEQQRNELTPSHVDHGLPFRNPLCQLTRTLTLHPEGPAGPWGGPELF
jgi:hypothetical protein